ncbi:MAG: HAD family phosphatase [bacterium]
MNYRKYSVIVFDLGNVLIPFNYDIVKEKIEKIEKGLGEKFMNLYAENYHVHRDYECSKLTTEQFLSIMIEWLDNKIDTENFCKIFSEIFTENKEVSALLPILKKDYKLVLLSNTNYIHQKYGWEQSWFVSLFDKLVLSYQVGANKPDLKIYKAVEEFTQLPPEEHLFIDDVADYAQGARNAGWDAIQFIGYNDLIEQLKLRGIINNSVNSIS